MTSARQTSRRDDELRVVSENRLIEQLRAAVNPPVRKQRRERKSWWVANNPPHVPTTCEFDSCKNSLRDPDSWTRGCMNHKRIFKAQAETAGELVRYDAGTYSKGWK